MKTVPLTRKSATPDMISMMYSIPIGTLANMRSKGIGPRFFRRGRRITYFIADVEAWLQQEPVQTTDTVRDAR